MGDEFKDDTLGDLKARDIENLERVLKDRTRHLFKSIKEAMMFQNKAVFSVLARLGVDINKTGLNADSIDRLLEKNHVKVENRQYEGEDQWRSGIYIYKDNEIADFVGAAKKALLSGPDGRTWEITTSFKSIEDAGKSKIFSL